MTEQVGDVPVALVGHSLGGRAALLATGDERVRAVVGLATWLAPGDPVGRRQGRRPGRTARVIAAAPTGILLPQSTIFSPWFAVLSVFVAINTVMYVALAVAKILPKVDPREWLPRRHQRAQSRSIHPVAPDAGTDEDAVRR